MELNDAIRKRRSIRKFSDTPVSRDVIDTLIEAAVMAPSASNLQAWLFFVIDDPALVRKVDLFSPGMSGNPPVIIAVASDIGLAESRGGKNSLTYGCMMDASMAAENLMLAAVEHGLGTCAIKSYNDAAVRKLLCLPDSIRLELLISLGYPDQEREMPPRKPLSMIRHYNTWRDESGEALAADGAE